MAHKKSQSTAKNCKTRPPSKEDISHRMADLFFQNLLEARNFERSYMERWKKRGKNSYHKCVGLFHYDDNKTCEVQLWHDTITGKLRWWFGFCLDSRNKLNELMASLDVKKENFFEDEFDDKWSMQKVYENSDSNLWYFGIYCHETNKADENNENEEKAIEDITAIASKLDDKPYLENNFRRKIKKTKEQRAIEKLIKNPERFEIGSEKDEIIEIIYDHRFDCTGDRVNAIYIYKSGTQKVVHGEDKNAINGCHKVLKYNLLRCLELGLLIKSSKVKSVLVMPDKAEFMTDKINKFRDKHKIKHEKCKI